MYNLNITLNVYAVVYFYPEASHLKRNSWTKASYFLPRVWK